MTNPIGTDRGGESEPTATLLRLNQEYIDAFLKADVGWYSEHLVDDFVCIEPDASRIGRDEFLRETARGTDVVTYTLKNVQVRTFGSVALVHATGDFVRRDGSTGTSVYTDAWAQLGGKWKAVSAQITRVPVPA